MITLFYGPDSYRSREEIKKVIEENKKANANWFNLVKIDAENQEINILDEVRRVVDTVLMFGGGKLIIIENIFSLSELLQKEISEFIKKRKIEKDSSTEIIFWSGEIDEKNDFFKFLKTRAKIEKFEKLKGYQLKDWIRGYVHENKGEIENFATDKLINFIGSDLWRMSNEINKLLAHNPVIRVEDVELLVRPEIDSNIFEMVDALGQKNKSRAMKLFSQHIKKGEDEQYLFSMFVYQMRNLIRVKAGGGGDLHPYVLQKTSQQAKNFSFEDLKKIYHQLSEIDLDAKTGRIDIRAALEMFIARL